MKASEVNLNQKKENNEVTLVQKWLGPARAKSCEYKDMVDDRAVVHKIPTVRMSC